MKTITEQDWRQISGFAPRISDAAQREKELRKLPKPELARMHVANGGQMGLATYMQWRKDELVRAVLEDEGIDPWAR